MKKMYTPESSSIATANGLSRTSTKALQAKVVWVVVTILVSMSQIRAQYAGTLNVPGNFATLKLCLDSLNVYGVSGSVTVNVTAAQTLTGTGNTSNLRLGSAVLNNSINAAAGRTLTFNGNGNTITAQTGAWASTTQPTFTNAIYQDIMWIIQSTDNVTINNFVFTNPAANTTTTTYVEKAIEFGLLSTATGTSFPFTNGCENITVTNCVFNFNDIGINATPISIVPQAANFTTNSYTTVFGTTRGDRHKNITIQNNTFNDAFNIIRVAGVNSDNPITNLKFIGNTATDIGGSGTLSNAQTCYAASIYYTDTIDCSNNTFSSDTDNLYTGFISILYPQYTAGIQRYSNNTFNMKMRNASSTLNAMQNFTYSWAAAPPVSEFTLRKNTVNFSNSSTHGNLPAISTSFTGFQLGGYVSINNGTYQNVNFFIDSNDLINTTFPGVGTLNFININTGATSGLLAGTRYFVRDNKFENVSRSGNGGTTAVYQKTASTPGLHSRFHKNTILNFNYTNAVNGTSFASFTGFNIAGFATGVMISDTVSNNRIENVNLSRLTTTTNQFFGIQVSSPVLSHVFENSLKNITLTSTNNMTGTSNIAYPLYSTTASPAVTNFSRNIVDSVRCDGFGTIYGALFASNGTCNLYSNYINNCMTPNSNNPNGLVGIYNSSSGILNAYNNTIRFGRNGSGPVTSTNTNFGGSGISYSRTLTGTSMNRIYNNIVHINATPTAGACFAALRSHTTSGLTTKSANIAADNNIYYINPSYTSVSQHNQIYCEGTAAGTLQNAYSQSNGVAAPYIFDTNFNSGCSLYKNWMGERNTFTENNLNAAGSLAGTFVPSGMSYAESSGIPTATMMPITPDLNLVARSADPDRGALQFAGTPETDKVPPAISYGINTTLTCLSAPSFVATITDASGINNTGSTKPRLYYRKSTNANAFGANTNAFNGWKYVEATGSGPYTFALDYTLLNGGAPVNADKLYYFFAAQDLAGTPNVSAVKATLMPLGRCPSTVDIGATPGITSVVGTDSFTINNTAPNIIIGYSPAVSCVNDTITHQIMVAGGGASPTTYAASNATSNAEVEIFSVTIGSMTNVSACTGALPADWPAGGPFNRPVSVVNMYGNYTNGVTPITPPNLIAGTTYPWSITQGDLSTTNWTAGYSIFIDYNRNGIFDLPAEKIAGSTASVAAMPGCAPATGSTYSGTFTVPTNISSGLTLARVVSIEATATPAPTGTYTWGETEDYTVNLIGTPANATYVWTSDKTGATVIGTTNPFKHAVPDSPTIYTAQVNISGCVYPIMDTVYPNKLPLTLQPFNSVQCGGGIPSCKVRDLNNYVNPLYEWYATATSTTPIQSGYAATADSLFKSPILSTTTLYARIQNPNTGCWSPRVAVTVTVNPADTFNVRGNGVVDSVNVCSNQPLNLTVTNVSNIGQSGGVFNNFTWSHADPNSGISSGTLANATGTQTITPLSGGLYVLTMTANNTGSVCRNTKYLKVNVQQNPFLNSGSFVATTPNPTCVGTPVTHTLFLGGATNPFPNYTGLGTGGTVYTFNTFFDLDTVRLNGFMSSTLCTSGGSATPANTLPASTTGMYSNYTNTGSIGTLTGGQTATVGLSTSTTGLGVANYNMAHAVFIDYNRNGAFEPAERVYGDNATFINASTSAACNAPAQRTGTFVVPTNVSSGPTLIRFMTAFSSVINSATVTNNYGETEDYMVTLIGQADTNTNKLSWNRVPYNNAQLGTDKVMVHALDSSFRIYRVAVRNGFCSDTFRDTVTNNVPAFAVTPIAGNTAVCSGENGLYSVAASGGCIPYSYNWASTGGTITPITGGVLNNDSVMFSPTGASGTKTLNLTITDNIGTSLTRSIIINYNNPTPNNPIPDTICGLQTATLCATPSVASDSLKWYTSATSLNHIATGNCYTTPLLNAQTIYWVRQFSSVLDSSMPRSTANAGTITNFVPNAVTSSRISVAKRMILNSVDIYPSAAGASPTAPYNGFIEVEVIDPNGVPVATSGVVNFSTTNTVAPASGTGTPVQIKLGAVLQPNIEYTVYPKSWSVGYNLDYGTRAAPNINPQTSTVGNFTNVRGVNNNNTFLNINFYFWNYQVEEGCWGQPRPDTVYYVAPPALTLSRDLDSVCSGSATTPVTLASPIGNFQTYTWALGATSPAPNVTTMTAAGSVFSEPVVGTYTYILNAAQTSGLLCASTDTFTLRVKTIPTPIIKAPAVASLDICRGSVVQMEALSTNVASGKVGAGTLTSAGSGASPFFSGWMDQRVQYIYTPAELNGLGILAGPIDSIGFVVTAVGAGTPTTFNNYTIKIGHTTATSLTGFEPSPAQTVYNQATYPVPAAGTTPRFPFTSSFNWDGTRNILVEICKDHNAWSGSVSVEGTNFTPQRTYGTFDDLATANLCASTSINTNPNFRPNMWVYQTIKYPMTWSPITRLFNDNALATAYTAGTARDTVHAAPDATTKYFMTATHMNGCAIQDSTTINVTDTVTITQQPPSTSNWCIGDTMMLVASATSNSPIAKQWLKGGVALSALNAPGLITGSQLTDTLKIVITSVSDSGFYNINFNTGAPCSPKFSNLTTVKVRTPVSITTQPVANTTICVGSTFSLNVATTNDSAVTWTQIGGGASTGLGKNITKGPPAAYADSGKYFFTVNGFSPCKPKNSDTVQVNILPPAQITAQPAALTTLCSGQIPAQSVTLKPTYTGGVQGFQWLKDGVAIPAGQGGTADTLVVTANSQADSGTYRLVVLSPSGCANDTTSMTMGVVKINLPVSISVQPSNNTKVCEGTQYSNQVTAANFSGYQWYKDGVAISGASGTTNPYIIPSVDSAMHQGIYSVEVLGLTSCPSLFSNGDTVRVIKLAEVVTDPVTSTVCEDQSLMMSVTATRASSYVWLFNGSPMVPAQSGSSITINPATVADSGMYSVIAVSDNGCKTDTSAIVLGAVKRKVIINTPPPAVSVGCVGVPYSIGVTATHVSSYQWTKDFGTMAAAGTATNSISWNPFAQTDTGRYTLVVNGNGPCPSVTLNSRIDPVFAAKIGDPQAFNSFCQNNTINLRVVDSNTSNTSTYQWFKDGVSLGSANGANTAFYSKPNATPADAGVYHVIAYAYSNCTNDTSANATVVIRTPLTFTTPLPSSSTYCEMNNMTHTVGVSGSGINGTSNFIYEWTQNSSPVGSNNATYAKNNLDPNFDAGTYMVQIKGDTACAAVTSSMNVTVNRSPVVNIHPNGAPVVCVGQNIVLNATASNFSTIDWERVGGGIVGTGNTYVKSATTADEGRYRVRVNPLPACVAIFSNDTLISVNSPATIVTHPRGAAVLETPAGSYSMTVTANGDGPFTYQWYKDNVLLAGATNRTYNILSYVPDRDSGVYTVKVTSPAPCANVVTSNAAIITTTKCPVITQQPVKRIEICKGKPFSMDVDAIGAKSYQWFKDGEPIENATLPNYSILNAVPSQSGLYTVQAVAYRLDCEVVMSDTVRVIVWDAPVITTQPIANTSCGSSQHTMSVAGDYVQTYQWFKNGVPVAPSGTGSSYTYTNVNVTGENFYVEVKNSICNLTSRSNVVNLKLVNPATQVKLATRSSFDLVERCTDNNNWTYYVDPSKPEELLFAIKKPSNASNAVARPDIEVLRGIRELSPNNLVSRGLILGSRLYNIDFDRQLTEPYQVKFYFSREEEDAVTNRYMDIKTTQGSRFIASHDDTISILTSTQKPFTNTLWQSVTAPLNIDFTTAGVDREYGMDNGVKYIIVKRLIGHRSGGSLFMDYQLKSSSGVTSVDANGFGVNLYPVPTNDGKISVEISSKRMKPVTFTVVDATGRTVAVFNEKHTTSTSKHDFDLTNLANGNYQMVIANGEEYESRMFSIAK